MRHPIILLLYVVVFMSACAHKNNEYNFEHTDSAKIDESKVVLTRFPIQLEEINDSVVASIHSYQTISLYNVYSGKNITNFSVSDINFDSLIQTTYQKKYKHQRVYTYDKESMTGPVGMGKVGLFQYANNNFYIYVNTQAEVDYLSDSTEYWKLNDNEKIKQLKKTHKKLNIKMSDYVQFLFITDDKFNVKEIIPLYESPLLKNNNYYPIYERAFYVDGNDLHFILLKNDEAYETMRSKKELSSYYTGVINLKDETKDRLLLNNKNINYAGFTFNDYLGSPTKFYNKGKQLWFANGKEICEANGGRKLFSGKNLQANEWMSSFHMDDDEKIIMVNYNMDKKQHPTEFEKHYAIDSVSTIRIKVFDTKKSQWLTEKELPSGFHFPYLVTKNKIIFMDKDKQNYYFKWIPYNEN